MSSSQQIPVLIVEDDRASSEVLQRRLQSTEFRIDVASTGEAAQDLIRTTQYGLVVIDLALPGLDGWSLLKWIQSQYPESPAKIVALTAYYDPSVAQQAREAGFIQCYAKPATQAIVEEMKALVIA